MLTVYDLGAEREAVAGQQDLNLTAREVEGCGVAARIGLLTDMTQICVIPQSSQHIADVTDHVTVALPGQLCYLAAAHSYRLVGQRVAHVLSSRKDEARSEAVSCSSWSITFWEDLRILLS